MTHKIWDVGTRAGSRLRREGAGIVSRMTIELTLLAASVALGIVHIITVSRLPCIETYKERLRMAVRAL